MCFSLSQLIIIIVVWDTTQRVLANLQSLSLSNVGLSFPLSADDFGCLLWIRFVRSFDLSDQIWIPFHCNFFDLLSFFFYALLLFALSSWPMFFFNFILRFGILFSSALSLWLNHVLDLLVVFCYSYDSVSFNVF